MVAHGIRRCGAEINQTRATCVTESGAPSINFFVSLSYILIAEALELWSFRLYESWVIYKNLNICDHDFRLPVGSRRGNFPHETFFSPGTNVAGGLKHLYQRCAPGGPTGPVNSAGPCGPKSGPGSGPGSGLITGGWSGRAWQGGSQTSLLLGVQSS